MGWARVLACMWHKHGSILNCSKDWDVNWIGQRMGQSKGMRGHVRCRITLKPSRALKKAKWAHCWAERAHLCGA